VGAAVVVAAIAVSAAVLLSDDETVRQQVGLQVISLQVHGDGLDPRYATAARLTVVGAVTKPGATPATSGSPSWLEVLEGAPAQLVRAYTQQVADGPPMGEAHRVMSSAPRCDRWADLVLRPCPARWVARVAVRTSGAARVPARGG
jgi:hypothetical protein